MRERPRGINDLDVATVLAEGWGHHVGAPEYVPKGAGSYHWRWRVPRHEDIFVTVDDLDGKPWLGTDREATFAGLQTAYDTAVRLQTAGLSFVVAPILSNGGRPLERLTSRYSVAVFPYVVGTAHRFGEQHDSEARADVEHLLAELHRATPAVSATALQRGFSIPGRADLDAALATVNERWTGPLGEPARRALAAEASAVRGWLSQFDNLAAQVAQSARALVITHGEPHPANLIGTTDGLRLIDWDTVALAQPERDLWMLHEGAPDSLNTYTALSGVAIDPAALELYRLAWTLTDLALYAAVLRAPHGDNADTRRAFETFTSYLS